MKRLFGPTLKLGDWCEAHPGLMFVVLAVFVLVVGYLDVTEVVI